MTNPNPKNNLLLELLQLLSAEGTQAIPQIIRPLLNESMLLERAAALEAAPYERTCDRKGYANGFKPKTIHTPLGSICVDVPQVRGEIDFLPQLWKNIPAQRKQFFWPWPKCTSKASPLAKSPRSCRLSAAFVSQAPK